MRPNYQKLTRLLGETRVLINEPLSKYSSFRLGGPADLFFKAKTTGELAQAIKQADSFSIPIFVLGGGTNLLISDKGFRGLVIKNETSGIKLIGVRGAATKVKKVFLEVDSGVGVNRLVRFALDQGLSGLEAFLGQPGTVGGAVYINAHNMWKGKFFGDCIVGAKIVTVSGDVKSVEGKYFKFGYDTSCLQKTKEIVLSVILQLETQDKEKLWQEAQKMLVYRQKTQPQGFYSSGCIFRNIEKSDALMIATPQFTCSAGFLLETIGLKGKKIGGAWFSSEHANFIVHRGGVTTSSVIELINL
ncbi:UDP-N-acetylmuramate dehydrogenase, partial [Candidatus Gottesmanbacteria bacterium]|nr:UDP-N-acetylmuramate dehydrogenase [Candidatus Gottesmanbacteria bacterium]